MDLPTSDPIAPEDSDGSDYGDFAEGPMAEMTVEVEVEDIYKYGNFPDSDDETDVTHDAEITENNYYYPICIGEVIGKRYRIVHKLGHGAFSTVWLARDLEKERDVALKIMISGFMAEHELRIQDEIFQSIKDTSNLLLYQDTFLVQGDNCEHRVLVFPAQGSKLSSFHTKNMPMAPRMSAARQLLKTLESLHKCGIVHGDVSAANVLWGMVPLDRYNTSTKYKYLGRPQKVALPSTCWKPGELISPAEVPKFLLTEKIYLGDFGLATNACTQVMHNWQPAIGYCAPERMHNFPASFAGDMWGYMCIFIKLYLDYSLFEDGPIAILGPMPEQWKGLVEAEDKWYDQNKTVDPRADLERRIKRKHPNASAGERDHIISIILRTLRYRPEERLTATQLLRDASFKEVMDIYCH